MTHDDLKLKAMRSDLKCDNNVKVYNKVDIIEFIVCMWSNS